MNLGEIKILLEESIRERGSPLARTRTVMSENYNKANHSMERSIVIEEPKKRPLLLISNKSVSPHTYLASPITFPKPKPNNFARRFSRVLSPVQQKIGQGVLTIHRKPMFENLMRLKTRESSNVEKDLGKRIESEFLLSEMDLSIYRTNKDNSEDSESCESFEYTNYDLTPKLARRLN